MHILKSVSACLVGSSFFFFPKEEKICSYNQQPEDALMATEVAATKTYWAFLHKETFYLHLNKLSLHVIALKLPCIPERTRGSKWHQQISTTEHMLLDYIRKVSTCLSLSAFSVSMTTCSCSFSFINSSLKVSRS